MKQLLLTFFAIILCYSFFFDNEAEIPAVDKINYIYEETSVPMHISVPDTLNYYSLYRNYSLGYTDYFNLYK